jgi:hypothetical protein
MAVAEKKCGVRDMWVPKKEPGQLESRVAGCSDNGDP